MTPLAAVASGLLAGAAGTASIDAVRYLMYRRGGGQDAPLAWEFAPVESWAQAPDPGLVTKRRWRASRRNRSPTGGPG